MLSLLPSGDVSKLWIQLFKGPLVIFPHSVGCFCCVLCSTLMVLILFLLCDKGTLADYVSGSSPMIPSLVVHCVNEIEQRGLNEVRTLPMTLAWPYSLLDWLLNCYQVFAPWERTNYSPWGYQSFTFLSRITGLRQLCIARIVRMWRINWLSACKAAQHAVSERLNWLWEHLPNPPSHVCLLLPLSTPHPMQAGLYRLSGAERTVRELKEKFLRGKAVPLLSKVDDIHAITGLLKDFLRKLREPLLTFRLNRTFMDAAGGCQSWGQANFPTLIRSCIMWLVFLCLYDRVIYFVILVTWTIHWPSVIICISLALQFNLHSIIHTLTCMRWVFK